MTRAGAGRGHRAGETHKGLFLRQWAKLRPAPRAIWVHPSQPWHFCPLTPTRVSSLGCQSFHRCPLGSAIGQDQVVRGGLQGPLPSKEEGSRVTNAISKPCVAATPINDVDGLSCAALGCSQGSLGLRKAPLSLVLWWVCTPRPTRGDFCCNVQLPPPRRFKSSWFGNGFHTQSE